MIREIYHAIKWRLHNYAVYFALKKEFSREFSSLNFQLEKEKRKDWNSDKTRFLQDKKDKYLINFFQNNYSEQTKLKNGFGLYGGLEKNLHLI